MRTVHPDIIDQLSPMFDVLTDVSSFYDRRNDEKKQSSRESVDELLNRAGEHSTVVREMLKRLFPPTRTFLENYIYGPDWTQKWRRERRVAHPDVLRFYLEKRLPDDVLPTPYIRAIFESLGDAAKLRKLLEPLNDQNLETMLDRLEDYENEYPPEVIQTAVEVLSEVEGRLREGQLGLDDPFGASMALVRVLFRLLRRAGPPPNPFEVVERAILRVGSLSARALLISIVGTEQDVVEIGTSDDRARLITVLGRQVTVVPRERLRNERQLDQLLRIAKTHGNAGAEFFDHILEDDELLLRFLSSNLKESFSVTVGDVAQRKRRDLSWKKIEEVVGAELLRRKVLVLASKAPNITDERKRVALELAVSYAKST